MKNRRILVVDDNHSIHDDFRKILGGISANARELTNVEASLFGDAANEPGTEGFEINFAFQGQEGLEKVRQALGEGKPYAMAFIDVRMPPGWDGIKYGKWIPIFKLSSAPPTPIARGMK
jgi:CheY-like chemotaxis protein